MPCNDCCDGHKSIACAEIDKSLSFDSTLSIDSSLSPMITDDHVSVVASIKFLVPSNFKNKCGGMVKDLSLIVTKPIQTHEYFHQVLSCDLPPDILNFENGHIFVTSFGSRLYFHERHIDFIGCSRYLGNFITYSFELYLKNPSSSIEFLTCAHGSSKQLLSCDLPPDIKIVLTSSLLFSLKVPYWRGLPHAQPSPYILEPSMIDPEPPPRKDKIGRGGRVTLKSHMFLIRDENFSFKSLKRFKLLGCPFPSLPLIFLNSL